MFRIDFIPLLLLLYISLVSNTQKHQEQKLKTHEALTEALLWAGSGVSSLIDLVLDVQKWSAQSSNSHGGKVWCWEIPEIQSGWNISYKRYNPFISWFFRKFSEAPKYWTEFVRASNLHIKQIHGYSWRVTFDGGKSLKITLNNLNGFFTHTRTPPHPLQSDRKVTFCEGFSFVVTTRNVNQNKFIQRSLLFKCLFYKWDERKKMLNH